MATDEMTAAKPKRRKPIPTRVKFEVLLRQDGRCGSCGARLGSIDDTQFDHTPALELRPWDGAAGDTVPPANDPASIIARHVDCHKAKTTGRRGEKLATTYGSDAHAIAKTRRLEKRRLAEEAEAGETDETRRKLLRTKRKPAPKSRWPRRPLSSKRGRKNGRSTT